MGAVRRIAARDHVAQGSAPQGIPDQDNTEDMALEDIVAQGTDPLGTDPEDIAARDTCRMPLEPGLVGRVQMTRDDSILEQSAFLMKIYGFFGPLVGDM